MKIIIRNRNKEIQVSNITSKEEMVWIAPELYAEITKDAGVAATEVMKQDLLEVKEKYGDERRTEIIPFDHEFNAEDFYADDGDGQSHCGQDAQTENDEQKTETL